MIKLYLNNDTTGVEITSYNHYFRRQMDNNLFHEEYSVVLANATDIDALANQFDGTIITDIVIKKDNVEIKNITNLQLYINTIMEQIDDSDMNRKTLDISI